MTNSTMFVKIPPMSSGMSAEELYSSAPADRKELYAELLALSPQNQPGLQAVTFVPFQSV